MFQYTGMNPEKKTWNENIGKNEIDKIYVYILVINVLKIVFL